MPNLSRSYHQPTESVKKSMKTIISPVGSVIDNIAVIPPLKRCRPV
jgi:hypothetical protein